MCLGTEPPSKQLLSRRPYRRDASLISNVMWSNIAFQSFFQIVLLCYLLIGGADDFNVVEGSATHYTIIFTTFVFCQVFNEFNARSIGHEYNVFSGLYKNIVFVAIEVFTVLIQIALVEYGGDFIKVTPLSFENWKKCILLASLTIPIGGLMRFSPIRESENDFSKLPEVGVTAQNRQTIARQKSNNGMNIEKSHGFSFSGLVWFVAATSIPVVVWVVFGESWSTRCGPMVQQLLQDCFHFIYNKVSK